MIRFLNLEDQICAGEKHFAFYDTVSGTICSFGGEQVFSSVEDFECAHREEQTIRPISRFLSLIPEGKWLHTGKKLPDSPDFDTWLKRKMKIMDAEGYPEERELAKIRNWDCGDFPNLLDFVEDLHIYKEYIKREIGKDYHGNPILIWSFSTGGWSGNEDLINALIKNTVFSMWHYSWRAGGHYVFKINPRQVGFQLVKDYCRENKVSRQWISKAKDKFEYFKLSPNKIFVRLHER